MDVNAPDLYIPLVSAWLYVTLLCLNAMLLGKYKPDIVYSKASVQTTRICQLSRDLRPCAVKGTGRVALVRRCGAYICHMMWVDAYVT